MKTPESILPEILLPNQGAVSSSTALKQNINGVVESVQTLLAQSAERHIQMQEHLGKASALERNLLRELKSMQARAETLQTLAQLYAADTSVVGVTHEGFDDLSRVDSTSSQVMVSHSRLALQPKNLTPIDIQNSERPTIAVPDGTYETIPGTGYPFLFDQDETTGWGVTVKRNGNSRLQITLTLKRSTKPMLLLLDGDFGLGASMYVEGLFDEEFLPVSHNTTLTDHNKIAIWTNSKVTTLRLVFNKPGPDYKNEHYYFLKHLVLFSGTYEESGVYRSKSIPVRSSCFQTAGPLTVLMDPDYALTDKNRIRMLLAEDPYVPGAFEDSSNNVVSPDDPAVDHYDPDESGEYTRASILRQLAHITGVPSHYKTWEPGNWRYPLDLDADRYETPESGSWTSTSMGNNCYAINTLTDVSNQDIDLVWGQNCMEYVPGTITRQLSQPAIAEENNGEYYAYFVGTWGYRSILGIYNRQWQQKVEDTDYTVESTASSNETIAIASTEDSEGWFAEYTMRSGAYWSFTLTVEEKTTVSITDTNNKLTYIDILQPDGSRVENVITTEHTLYTLDFTPGVYTVYLFTDDNSRWDPAEEDGAISFTGTYTIAARPEPMKRVPESTLLAVVNPNHQKYYSIRGSSVIVRDPSLVTGRLYDIDEDYDAMDAIEYDKFFRLRIYSRLNRTDHVLAKFEMEGGDTTPEIYGFNIITKKAGSDDYLYTRGAGSVGVTSRAAASSNPSAS